MLARSKPFCGGEGDNARPPLLAAPSGKRLVRALEVGKVDMRRNSPPNNATVGIVIGDVKHSVPVLNVQWFCDEDFRFEQVPHSLPLHSRTTERVPSGTLTFDSIKDAFAINGEWSPIFRQTAEQLRVVIPETSQIKSVTRLIPANDNDAPWHPLDVA